MAVAVVQVLAVGDAVSSVAGLGWQLSASIGHGNSWNWIFPFRSPGSTHLLSSIVWETKGFQTWELIKKNSNYNYYLALILGLGKSWGQVGWAWIWRTPLPHETFSDGWLPCKQASPGHQEPAIQNQREYCKNEVVWHTFKTLQFIMNAKFSLLRFQPCHKCRLIEKTIPTIPTTR